MKTVIVKFYSNNTLHSSNEVVISDEMLNWFFESYIGSDKEQPRWQADISSRIEDNIEYLIFNWHNSLNETQANYTINRFNELFNVKLNNYNDWFRH